MKVLQMKILIVDAPPLFRSGLSLALEALGEPVTILEASPSEYAFQEVFENPGIGLVLLDLDIPGNNGFTA